ncbi:hypothetical protein V6N13_046682 [Hibiscus sabdariffa]
MRKRSLHVSGAKLPKGRPISCLLLFACSGGAAFAEFVEIEAKQHLALPRVLCRRRGGFGFGRGKAVGRQRVLIKTQAWNAILISNWIPIASVTTFATNQSRNYMVEAHFLSLFRCFVNFEKNFH